MEKEYRKKDILTWNEKNFYDKIKKEVYRRGFHIITKIRLADLIEPTSIDKTNEWYKQFGKIKSKHIDFAIINDNMDILFLIELDDKTHTYSNRAERDEFVNISLVNAGYMLLRVYNTDKGVNNIINYMERNL